MDKGKFFISILPSTFQGSEDFRWNLMNDMDTSGISSHIVSCKKVTREQHEATSAAAAWRGQDKSDHSGYHDSRVHLHV